MSTSMSMFAMGPCAVFTLMFLAADLVQGVRVAEDLDEPCEGVSIYAPFHDLQKVKGIGKGRAKVISKARFCPLKDEDDFAQRYQQKDTSAHWAEIEKLLQSKELCVGEGVDGCKLEVNSASWWKLKEIETITERMATIIVAVRNCKIADEAELEERILAQPQGKIHWESLQKILQAGGLCFKDYIEDIGDEAAVIENINEDMDAEDEEEGGDLDPEGQGPQTKTKEVDENDGVDEIVENKGVAGGDATAESIGASWGGHKIKVVGFPEEDFKSEGDAKWDGNKKEFNVFVRRQSGSDGYDRIYGFKEGDLEITGSSFKWTCYHFKTVVISGTLSGSGVDTIQMEKLS